MTRVLVNTTHFLYVIVILFAIFAFLPFQAQAGPIEDLRPGEWYEVPNSHLLDVGADPTELNLSGSISRGLMAAWSGGVFDTKRDRLIIWGGGHNDYGGNEFYAFDVNLLRWLRLTEPTPNPNRCQEVNSDGTPVASHTYNGLAYIANGDRCFCVWRRPLKVLVSWPPPPLFL